VKRLKKNSYYEKKILLVVLKRRRKVPQKEVRKSRTRRVVYLCFWDQNEEQSHTRVKEKALLN